MSKIMLIDASDFPLKPYTGFSQDYVIRRDDDGWDYAKTLGGWKSKSGDTSTPSWVQSTAYQVSTQSILEWALAKGDVCRLHRMMAIVPNGTNVRNLTQLQKAELCNINRASSAFQDWEAWREAMKKIEMPEVEHLEDRIGQAASFKAAVLGSYDTQVAFLATEREVLDRFHRQDFHWEGVDGKVLWLRRWEVEMDEDLVSVYANTKTGARRCVARQYTGEIDTKGVFRVYLDPECWTLRG